MGRSIASEEEPFEAGEIEEAIGWLASCWSLERLVKQILGVVFRYVKDKVFGTARVNIPRANHM